MSGYLVLVYFFLWSPGILQERYFETKTFLCLDWKDVHWVCLLCFGFAPTPSIQYVPLPHFGYNYFSPCPLGFESPTTFLNLDLIYSTNVWEKWELGYLVCLRFRLSWKLLLYMQIMPFPRPLPSFLTKKATQWGFLLEAEEQSWPTEPWGCNVKGRRLTFMSYLCLLIKWEFVGFKNCF